MASVRYRSAGTVEFVYDPVREEAAFLEVNTRLQVEHPVTELAYGVDLVELMLRLARDGADDPVVRDALDRTGPRPVRRRGPRLRRGPRQAGRPLPRPRDERAVPAAVRVRVDGWVETGTEVTPFYDPLLAKVVASAPGRDAALDLLGEALTASRVDGVVTNLGLLRSLVADLPLRSATHPPPRSTSAPVGIDAGRDPDPRIDVLAPGP